MNTGRKRSACEPPRPVRVFPTPGDSVRRSGPLRLVGRPLPSAGPRDPRPDWLQASPAWIAGAVDRSQRLPSGGWYVLTASREVTSTPRALRVSGRSLVLWHDGAAIHVAPDVCPHLGAPLSSGRVRDGRLVCPWHGLALGPTGHGDWQALPTYDDGVLVWVQLDDGTPRTATPFLPPRPRVAIDAVIAVDVACEPRDVIANRLDPWHGVHYHPSSFASLQVLDQRVDEITVRVAYSLIGSLAVEVDARFHCSDPRTIVMTVVAGEGEGSMVETHATPRAAGLTRVVEATLITSERPGFARAFRATGLVRGILRWASHRLWRDDARYAERLYALRTPGGV